MTRANGVENGKRSDRDDRCPICTGGTEQVIRLRFTAKMDLPTEPEFRFCASDNLLFLSKGRQADYDQYYAAFASDSCHQEVSAGAARSPIAQLQSDHLLDAIGTFFEIPRKVMDFGCGEACLLIELAIRFPSSRFFGFEPGPAAHRALRKIDLLGLENLSIRDLNHNVENAPFDLIIASHVLEHLISFDSLSLLARLLRENGMLYTEVPDPLSYSARQRREFLYYFDRLHVNHFTPQSLSRLGLKFGFGPVKHFQYSFPYRDGGEYPAFGMLLKKGLRKEVVSPSVLEAAKGYIAHEKTRAREAAAQLEKFDGVLLWGVGDNFFRSLYNGGPLSSLRKFVLLDRRPQQVLIGDQIHRTEEPLSGIRQYGWPVVVTVSEGRDTIRRQINEIDPNRCVVFI